MGIVTSTTNIVFTVARLITCGLLLWALARHPIGYYTVLRVVTCTVCAYGVYCAIKSEQKGWGFAFGAIAILFQPIISLRMTRQTWEYVDMVTAIFLFATIFLFSAKPKRV